MSRAADLAAGLYGGVPAPYGWVNDGRRIHHHPKEWPIVEAIIKMYEEDGLTMREIGTVLNKSGSRSRNGRYWNKDKIQNVLSSIHVHKGVGYTMGKHRKPTMVIAINKGENHEQDQFGGDTQQHPDQLASGDGAGRRDRQEAWGEQGVRDAGSADEGDPVVPHPEESQTGDGDDEPGRPHREEDR